MVSFFQTFSFFLWNTVHRGKVIITGPITIITLFTQFAWKLNLLHYSFYLFIFCSKTIHIRIGIHSIVLPGSSGWHVLFSLQTTAILYWVSMLDRRVLYWKGKRHPPSIRYNWNHQVLILNINKYPAWESQNKMFHLYPDNSHSHWLFVSWLIHVWQMYSFVHSSYRVLCIGVRVRG